MIESILLVFGSNFIFGFIIDYLGYNFSRRYELVDSNLINPYRIFQISFQAIMYFLLWYFFGIYVSIGSILQWWTWNGDLWYYVAEWIFGLESKISNFDNKKVFNIINNNLVSWAFFTPIGIYYWIKTGNRNTRLNGKIIYSQAFMGLVLSILILYI